MIQEPVFIPRNIDAPEGDGYLMALVERYDLHKTELVILDTDRFEGPPVGVARLPLKLKGELRVRGLDSNCRSTRLTNRLSDRSLAS